MRKATHIVSGLLSCIFTFNICALFSGCHFWKGFFGYVFGEWECDELFYACYPSNVVKEMFIVKIRVNGEVIDVWCEAVGLSWTCTFTDKNRIIKEYHHKDGTSSYNFEPVWRCDFDLTKNGDLKVKVTEDYRYNGSYKGKVFYLTKISDSPQNDSLPEISIQTEDGEPEDVSSAI